MMIEQVMIELGGGTREELAMLRMQEAKAKNQLGKHRMRKAKSHKAKKPPAGNAEDAK